jgi:hypothetical protein
MKSLARFGRGEDDGMKNPCAARMHKCLGNEGALQQGVMVVMNLKYNCVHDLLWDSGEHVIATEGIHIVAAPRRGRGGFYVSLMFGNLRSNLD